MTHDYVTVTFDIILTSNPQFKIRKLNENKNKRKNKNK